LDEVMSTFDSPPANRKYLRKAYRELQFAV